MRQDKNRSLGGKSDPKCDSFRLIDLLRAASITSKMTAAKIHFNLENLVKTLDDSLKPSTSIRLMFLDFFLIK